MEGWKSVLRNQNSVLQPQLLIDFLQMLILNSKPSFSIAYTNAPYIWHRSHCTIWCHGHFSLLDTMAGRYTEEEIAKSSIFLPPFMFSVYMSGSRWRPNDQIISLTPVSLLKLLNNSLNLNNIFNFWDEDQSSILTK